MKKFVVGLLAVCAVLIVSVSARAQWTQVLQLPGTWVSSAYFFNATEGMIGTGTYRPKSSTLAAIYITNDGGSTWHTATLPNPNIVGQITDIYFRDRMHGWATLSEATSKGWGGLYRSIDGGETWRFVRPAGNAGGVRETKRGVFYTDRTGANGFGGILFSSDQGANWSVAATTDYPLSIDFIDDATGVVTAQGNSLGLHLITTDSGKTWNPIPASWKSGDNATEEAWTTFGDPVTRKFFIASEHWPLGANLETSVFTTPVKNPLEIPVKTYNDSGISGGVAGAHSCRSIVYVQGWSSLSNGPRGLIRSTDGGANWKFIGGPSNWNDTRFAVTGRGAVVFAGDQTGGVWRTVTGGDSAFSPSILSSVDITPENSNAANGCYAIAVCDSAVIPIRLNYNVCDSVQVASVEFPNDTAHELSAPPYLNDFRFFSNHLLDTLTLLYRPHRQESWTAKIRITFRQGDGYLEDTTISVLFNGLSPKVDPLIFTETTAPDSLDFGAVSLCADADRKVTLTNTGCADLVVETVRVNGAQFFLQSSFRPFTLSPGNSRSFLVHYKPSGVTPDQGSFYVQHSSGQDAVILTGKGFAPDRTLSLHVDSVFSPLCDSSSFSVQLRNISCTPFKILSVTTNTPIRAGALPSIDSLRQGETTDLPFTFTPVAPGATLDTIHIRVAYEASAPYDTTIVVAAITTSGAPDITLSTQTLSFGSSSICSDALDTLILHETGCGDVTVAASFDGPSGFSIVRGPKGVIPMHTSDTIILLFHPSQTIGTYSTHLILTTSAGTKTILCSIQITNDPGNVALAVSQNIRSYTCQSQPFNLSISNATCDSILVTGIALGGGMPQDFSVTTTIPMSLVSGETRTIDGIFSPQDSLARSATVKVTILRKGDGATFDTTIAINALGIGVPPIRIGLENKRYAAKTFASVRIPIYALTSSVINLNSFDVGLRFNTDLLTPLHLVAGKGLFGNATPTFTVTKDSLSLQLTLPADVALVPGELCEIECLPYIAKDLMTPITIGHARFNNLAGITQCFTTGAFSDSATSFALDPDCGDSTLSTFIGTGKISLERISPNPTSGVVMLDFSTPLGYRGDAAVDVYDALGIRLCSMPFAFDGKSEHPTIELDLHKMSGTSGVRYLRVRIGSRSMGAKVLLMER